MRHKIRQVERQMGADALKIDCWVDWQLSQEIITMDC